MIIENSTLLFESTGRAEYQHADIVGINPQLEVSYGYDGGFDFTSNYKPILPIEREELADFMINLWQQFKENAIG